MTVTKNETPKRTSLLNQLLTGQVSYEIVARRKVFYLISLAIIVIAVGGVLIRGLELAIEFRGGSEFRAPTTITDTTVSDVRDALASSDVPDLADSTVTTIGEGTVRVQTRPLDQNTEVPAVRELLAQTVNADPAEITNSSIGPTWGGQVARQALIALVVFLVLVAAFIALYFRNVRMSVAAIVALFHDILVTVCIFAIAGFTVSPVTVIGLLTILGYSLYDTVVVFDRVRENMKSPDPLSDEEYARRANLAINQVMIRSLNTTLTGVLPVLALLIFGLPGPLKDLGLVLLVGMIAGAYSSLFLATSMLVDLRRVGRNRDRDRAAQKQESKERSKQKVSVTMADDGSALSLTSDDSDAEDSDADDRDEDADTNTDEDDDPTGDDDEPTDSDAKPDRKRRQPTKRPRSKRK